MNRLLALLLLVPSLCLSQSDYCDTILPYATVGLQNEKALDAYIEKVLQEKASPKD